MPNLAKNISIGLLRLLARSLRRLSDYEAEGLARHYSRQRGSAAVQRLAFFAKCIASEFYGVTNHAALNGEAWLIRRTGALGFKTIFDVGANIGEWATDALSHHPAATVHCFEIVPATFLELQKNLAPFQGRCHLNQFGLSDGNSMVDMFVDPTNNLVSSLYFIDSPGRHTVQGELRCAAVYVLDHGIEHIDYVKIDVEGAEAMVLKGLLPQLQAGRIRLLHFEYNRGALESRFLLKDFYAMLQPLGYRLGKLLPQGVLFQDYRWDLEDFMGPNYVACRNDDQEMLSLLALHANGAGKS